jgi:ubiquitin carboxyl-terminal hydrolase L5
MAAYEEDQIEFSILGLVRDPLPDLLSSLAINVRSLEILSQRAMSLSVLGIEVFWDELILGPEPSLGLTREDIDAAEIPDTVQNYQSCSAKQLQKYQQELSKDQKELRIRIREEQQSQRKDDEYAAGRRFDYSPAVRTWLRLLARKQELQELQTALVAN